MDDEVSKAHPDARFRGIGFRIGDVFPADDPIARWTTVLAMAANNTVYLNVRMIEGRLPAELDVYYFRLVAAHFFEAVEWLRKTRRTWPEIDAFICGLEPDDQARFDTLVAFASQTHPLNATLRRSRVTLFHYPEMHPGKAAAKAEELATAMGEAADLEGWIEDGGDFASFRATFADEVATQFVAADENASRELMDALHDPVFELVQFAAGALLAQLKRGDPKRTVLWRQGQERPAVPPAQGPQGGGNSGT